MKTNNTCIVADSLFQAAQDFQHAAEFAPEGSCCITPGGKDLREKKAYKDALKIINSFGDAFADSETFTCPFIMFFRAITSELSDGECSEEVFLKITQALNHVGFRAGSHKRADIPDLAFDRLKGEFAGRKIPHWLYL